LVCRKGVVVEPTNSSAAFEGSPLLETIRVLLFISS
jgi:hypothetical protein